MSERELPEIHGDAAGDWLETFKRHERRMRRLRRARRLIPSNPRCKLCLTPFGGLGPLFRLRGYSPSRKNPTLCSVCIEKGPQGGFETETGVLFADVRGYTNLAERMSPGEVAALLNRFYGVATDVLVARDAIVDKLAGDAVMAIFWPPLLSGPPLTTMVEAGEELLRGVGFGESGRPWLDLGVGMHYGPAFMGNVGASGVHDFTALGDAVNVASRLQASAAPGEMLLSEPVYGAVRGRYPEARPMELELKGKSEPVRAWAVAVGARAAAA